MQPRTIAILSPGDMGSGVGRDLRERGFDVVTCLAGRGADSRSRARSAGFRELPDLDALVAQADLVLCYAAISKGTNTLHTATLIAAEALGVGEILRAELADSAAATYRHMRATVPRLPADAARWVGEMEEIARTFEAAGVTPHFHQGARDTFKLLASTPFAAETRATIDPNRTLEQSVKVYLDHRPGRPGRKSVE